MKCLIPSKKTLLAGSLLLVMLGVLVGGWGGYRHFAPVSAAKGWHYRVFKDAIDGVSALAIMGDGSLYFTQEFGNEKGTLLRLEADGSVCCALNQLSKPDGLATFRSNLLISQEGGHRPLLILNGTDTSPLFWAENLEGIASDETFIYAVEDLPQGRLLQFDPVNDQLKVLRSGLHEPEGLCITPDGHLFYTEKGLGTVKQWNPHDPDRIVLAGLNQPGFVCWSEAGLWITEDATHGARLLLIKNNGTLQVILKHLRSAQTLLPLDNGHYLLAEQGRDRILEIIPAEVKK
ncbi:MAG: hypothetical protein RBR43_05720 [Desulfuromonadaceae bacterium]|nr:hypothetical protein [Desulfuromonas sp.]MDY0185359.1 hypothetical protein [Desulfuromonadaceae bacterium]